MFYEVASSVVARSAAAQRVVTDGTNVVAGMTAPQINWVPSRQLKEWAATGAWIIIAAWLIFIAMQYVVPSRRGRGQVPWAKFMASLVICVFLFDLTLVPTIVNGLANGTWYVLGLIGLTSGPARA